MYRTCPTWARTWRKDLWTVLVRTRKVRRRRAWSRRHRPDWEPIASSSASIRPTIDKSRRLWSLDGAGDEPAPKEAVESTQLHEMAALEPLLTPAVPLESNVRRGRWWLGNLTGATSMSGNDRNSGLGIRRLRPPPDWKKTARPRKCTKPGRPCTWWTPAECRWAPSRSRQVWRRTKTQKVWCSSRWCPRRQLAHSGA